MPRILPWFALTLALLAGCAAVEDPTKDWAPERFYQEAREKMQSGDYETAIKHFEALEARYPYGRYAEQAQLEIAYAYYKYDEPALPRRCTSRTAPSASWWSASPTAATPTTPGSA